MWRIPFAAFAVTMLMAAGCGESADAPETAPRATEPGTSGHGHQTVERTRPTVHRSHCAASAANCAAVTGRVLYVEAVDPDGDGDAHYVLVGGHVTAPGVSVIDVERALRPRRLPRAGDLVSAAGPVYTGSHGQRQIQAVELHYARR